MADRPLIVFPTPALATRSRPPGGGQKLHLPGRSRQANRLGPKFQALHTYFQRESITLHASAAGQIPEEVIVFETVGSVKDFFEAAQRIPGLDMLGEWDVEDISPDGDFYRADKPEEQLSGRLFVVMSNQQALDQLLSLWQRYQRIGTLPTGFGPYTQLFRHLRDVRLWSVKDRLLETGIVEYWEQAATSDDQTTVPFGIELWFRDSPEARQRAVERIKDVVAQLGGRLGIPAEIPEICYHGVVAMLPAAQIRGFTTSESAALLSESVIMYFRPTGQSVTSPPEQIILQAPIAPAVPSQPAGAPTVALLDGMPLESHVRLAGRLRVDDPDGFAGSYAAAERDHGTTMASIIVHGDLNAPGAPLPTPLYVRPIMRPDPQPWDSSRMERIPHDEDEIDLVHRAVRRLFQPSGSEGAVAPSVRIINLSIGDSLQQFNGVVSAWGRLLDWLSLEHNVLILVSCGNHPSPIELDVARTRYAALSARQKETALLKAIYRELRLRRILSPSDAINAVNVGGWHYDAGPVAPIPHRFDPFTSVPLPSPVNAVGCGFRNGLKPDVLLPAGRQFYDEQLGTMHPKAILRPNHATIAPGILAASPTTIPGQLDREKHTRGSSNATAFGSRSAAFIREQLVLLRAEPGGDQLTDEFTSVLLKAALIHGASWGAAYDHLKLSLKPRDMREDAFKRLVARFLGYGFVAPIERIVSSDHRATMVGCGQLADEQAHRYELPLPPSLNGVRGLRRVTTTIAWMSPIHPRHRNYRRAALWFDFERQKLGISRRETEWKQARNGTVQHEVFEGERAAVYDDDDTLLVQVNCRADAGSLHGHVRYAIFVTFEVAEELRIPLYDEIATRIRPPIAVGTSAA